VPPGVLPICNEKNSFEFYSSAVGDTERIFAAPRLRARRSCLFAAPQPLTVKEPMGPVSSGPAALKAMQAGFLSLFLVDLPVLRQRLAAFSRVFRFNDFLSISVLIFPRFLFRNR
jgi:hypothetical protein